MLSPPTDVGTAGRSAVIADPAGAALRLWQAASHRGAQVVNADSAWNWSNLVVAEPAAVGDFYRAVFGWELTASTSAAPRPSWCAVPATANTSPSWSRASGNVRTNPAPRPASPMRWRGWRRPRRATGDVADRVRRRRHRRHRARAVELGGQVRVEPYDAGPVRAAVLVDDQGTEFTVNHFDPSRLCSALRRSHDLSDAHE